MAEADFLRSVPVDPDVARAFDTLPLDLGELGFDQWGFHAETAKRLYSLARPIARYFRPLIDGIENIPKGRVLIVPNHSGQLPFDGLVVAMACLLNASPPRLVRPMAERWFPTIPFINMAFSRAGVVVGDPINCKNLLEADNAILVFPEGARGCGKPWSQRYKLVDFGRGFMRLALQTGTPIVPVSVVGAEESIPSLTNLPGIARRLGVPYIPVPPHLPLLGPLAYLPLPTRFYVDFGAPLTFEGPYDDEDDAIQEKVDLVQSTVQGLIDARLARRPSVFG